MNSCSIDENTQTCRSQFTLTKLRCTLLRRMKRLRKFGVMICTLLIISTALVVVANNVCHRELCSVTDAKSHSQIIPHQPHVFTESSGDTKSYEIVLVADLDDRSRVGEGKEVWQSFLLEGKLSWDGAKSFQVGFEEKPVSIRSDYSRGGRGMELSELIMFDGELLSVDDRTGIIFKLRNKRNQKWDVIPWILSTDGDGNEKKGFKAEWMTVKDNRLYVGGWGKEWTSVEGEYINDNPMFIKIVSKDGSMEHRSWKDDYLKLREHLNISSPGYVIHEAVMWSEYSQKWVFLPRRVSNQLYNDVEDEKRGSNLMMLCSEDLTTCSIKTVGTIIPTRGFSSLKFLPGTNEQIIVALKSEEDNGKITTYIIVFDLSGDVLMRDVKVGDEKYEGIEFL